MHKGIIATLAFVLPTPASAQEAAAVPATSIVAVSAMVAPAPVASYMPAVRHWPSRALPDQPTLTQRLQAVAPVRRAGRGWTISD